VFYKVNKIFRYTFWENSATAHWLEWSHSINDWIIGVPRATGYDTDGYKFLIFGWSPALYNLELMAL